jgi:hypothetical protein
MYYLCEPKGIIEKRECFNSDTHFGDYKYLQHFNFRTLKEETC